jgi:SAM-dependent methyltransferase
MRKEVRRNRLFWDWQTRENIKARHYEVGRLKRGGGTLHDLEIQEVGPVRGKRLLHLQCNVGVDSISWARRGARVTAVDYSKEALSFGRALAGELRERVEFVESDVYSLPRVLKRAGRYDLVFTSYGILFWLPDLRRWARVAAHFMKPGGTFYIVEHHPIATSFGDRWLGDGRSPVHSYFQGRIPLTTMLKGDVVRTRRRVRDRGVMHYGWIHPIGEVVSSLIEAGLRIEYAHEFPFSDFPQFANMRRGRDRMFRMPRELDKIPMTYSIKAKKPER